MHEESDLNDTPRYLITDALHWEGGRMLQTWSYRWSSELFHEFGKQGTGLESAQVRNEAAVKRHLRLSCVAQSPLQNLTVAPSTSERFPLARGQITFGQRIRQISRELLQALIAYVQRAVIGGKNEAEILDALMPA